MNLKQLHELIIQKESIQKKLEELNLQEKEIYKQIYIFEDKYREEKYDVDCLEGASLKSFLYKLLGNKDEILEKERQEAYEVKLKLDAYKYQYESILSDIESYKSKLEIIEYNESKYTQLLNEKKIQLNNHVEIIELEKRISDCNHQIKELNEAINEIQKAININDRIISDLDNSEFWATYDVIKRGGVISHKMKYDAIDKAQENINKLQIQLKRCKVELVDIRLNEDIKLSIDGFERTLDFWLDSFFINHSVRDKVIEANNQSKNTNRKLKTLKNTLNNMLEKEENVKSELENELARFIVNA